MRTLRVAFVLSFCLLVSTVAACGGGSGGGGTTTFDESLLSGDYFVWGLQATGGAPPHGSAIWGTAALDGMGGLVGMSSGNNNGATFGPTALPATYTVAADRETTMVLGGVSGYAGWTNAAGTLYLGGDLTPTENPAFINLAKLGTGLSNATLSGDYFIGMLFISTTGLTGSLWGTGAANGAGGATANLTVNNDGTILSPVALAAAYSVAADGQVVWAYGGGGPVCNGCVLAGGDLAVFTGDPTATEDPFVMVLVRKTAGATAATLGGTYHLVGIEGGGSSYTSLSGSVVSNGAGSITATFNRNTDGVISASGPDIAAYTAGADGSLVVNPGGDELHGGFSAGGAFFVLTGPTVGGTSPGFYVGMRR